MDFYKDSLERRRECIMSHPSFEETKLKIEDLASFIRNFTDLIWWKGNFAFLIHKNKFFFLQTEIMDSTHSTLLSIRQLVEIGHFSDVNVLMRKVRDDLFLFLYLLEVVNRYQLGNETTHERNATKWEENKLENLTISDILTYLMKNESIKKVIIEHNLRKAWDNIGKNLNNFVHGNGKMYAQLNYANFDYKTIDKIFNDITFKLSYIVSVFVVLLTLIKPSLISSSDYVDALELGIQPVEGSQYNIAPFIQKFIDTYVIKLHPDIKNFLKDNVYMRFD